MLPMGHESVPPCEQFSMVQVPPEYVTLPARLACLQVAVGPRVPWQSLLVVQLSPTFFGGVMHTPLSQTLVGAAQALQVSPLEPQMLLFWRVEPRGWQVPLPILQPSHTVEPPPAPPPAPPAEPPPVPPVVQANVAESHVLLVAAQSAQVLPEVPHVVLLTLLGLATHLPSLPQQPSHEAALHGV